MREGVFDCKRTAGSKGKIGKTEFLMLTHNRVYDVISIEKEWYRIVDDSGDDYLYPPENFETVKPEE